MMLGLAPFLIFLLPNVAVLLKAQLPHWNQSHQACYIIGINVIFKPTSLKNCFKTSNLQNSSRKALAYLIQTSQSSVVSDYEYGQEFYDSQALLGLVNDVLHYIKWLSSSRHSCSVNSPFLSRSYRREENVPELWLWWQSTSLIRLFYSGAGKNCRILPSLGTRVAGQCWCVTAHMPHGWALS
jgi:hypothetical protein